MLSIWAGTFSCTKNTEPVLPKDKVVEYTFNPETYLCYKSSVPIQVDGHLNEEAWQKAPWTNLFVDIEGDKKPLPTHPTRAKMLWDNEYFYVAAEIEEPHVWATLKQRDTVIFYDDDFEIFIDPDWDTHHYLEYEMNAYGTEWDLLLEKPYRDHTLVFDHFNFNGIKSAVFVDGTINNPNDVDKKWVVEIALPFDALAEAFHGDRLPVSGTQWRVNFSRVDWHMEIQDGRYVNMEAMPDLMFILSQEGTHVDYFTSDLTHLYIKPSDFIGRKVDDMYPPEVVKKYHDGINKVIKDKEVLKFEYFLDFDKDTRNFYEARMVLAEKKNVLVIIRDITLRKRAEDELKKYREHLKELVKERTKELEEKNVELEHFNSLFVGREFRIKELKEKVKELESHLKRG